MSELVIETPRAFLPLLDSARYKAAFGGRGSGKSWFFASLLIERCLIETTRAVCIREVQLTLAQSVKRLLEDLIESYKLSSLFDIQRDQIMHRENGSLVIFRGMQDYSADNIKSLEGFDVAWVEEAQTLSQRSLDLLRPTIRKPGSEIWFSWNPRFDTDPVDVFFRGSAPPDARIVEVHYSDNPWLPDPLRAEIDHDKKRDPDKFAHVWLGHYQRNSEARVFKNWCVEEFAAKQGTLFRFGADWGYSVDPSVLVRCYLEGHRLYIDHEAWMVGCEIDALPDLFYTVPESERWPIIADSARPETIAYLKRHGFPKVMAAVKGQKSLEEGIEFMRSFDIVVHPRCENVIAELTSYSYKTDPQTGLVLPILEDKNNHCIDAIRYALEGLRRATTAAAQKVRRVPVFKPRITGMGTLG